MQLRWIAEYHGPNPYALSPVVVAELAGVSDQMSNDWATLAASRLEEVFPVGLPGLIGSSVTCGGDGGKLLASVAVRWALAVLNEVRGCLFDGDVLRQDGKIYIWIGFHHASLSRDVLQLALKLAWGSAQKKLNKLIVLEALDRIWKSCRQHHPDYQARILMVGARKMGVPYLPFVPGSKYWQFGWGENSQIFFESSSNADGFVAGKLQRDKALAKEVMVSLGMPTPLYLRVAHEHELEPAVARIGYPCVLKPVDGGGGKGVTANISDIETLRAAYAYARRFSDRPLVLEQHVPGMDHRLMVIDGRLVAAIRREPSFVVGDGSSTVAELLADLNRDRSRNLTRSRYLRPIPQDEVLVRHLATQGLRLSDVLEEGRRVSLRSNANLSTGGVCTDMTEVLNPQVRAMAEQFALSLGLATAGLDYLTTDITRSPGEVGGSFIELNSTPGLDACIAAGWSEESIATQVLRTTLGRIAVELCLVAPETLDRRMAEMRLGELEPDQGWVCGESLHIGSAVLHGEAVRSWGAVNAALRNRRLRRLRVLCTPEEIMQRGLPVDQLSSVEMEEVTLPDEWLKVVDKCLVRCSQVKLGDDPEPASVERIFR